MHCPSCAAPTLKQRLTRQGTLVGVCSRCQGFWLDGSEILEFTDQPQQLEEGLEQGLSNRQGSEHRCPRCQVSLEQGILPILQARVEQCPCCRGLWLTAAEVRQLNHAGTLHLEVSEEHDPTVEEARSAVQERLQQLASGLLALPNLALRSTFTLALLYGLLTLILITLSVMGVLSPHMALILGVSIALLQFLLAPWVLDLCLRWLYRFRWLSQEEIPEHLRTFIARVCAEQRMRFPSIGLLDDGAPAAFTYGHHPSNARIVISRGLLELLEPTEVEAVVAHELGHARNWDMVLMTLANLVPLLLYFVYRLALDRSKKDSGLLALGAYVLYIVSQYLVLWFSRTREYYADRFAGRVTGNPNALATALVKIAYGLAAQKGVSSEEVGDKKDKAQRKEKAQAERLAAFQAMNIFDKNAAVALVVASASPVGIRASQLDPELVKGAMQWDLWNPGQPITKSTPPIPWWPSGCATWRTRQPTRGRNRCSSLTASLLNPTGTSSSWTC